MGKGDWRRPMTPEAKREYDARWEATFGKNKKSPSDANWTEEQMNDVLDHAASTRVPSDTRGDVGIN